MERQHINIYAHSGSIHRGTKVGYVHVEMDMNDPLMEELKAWVQRAEDAGKVRTKDAHSIILCRAQPEATDDPEYDQYTMHP